MCGINGIFNLRCEGDFTSPAKRMRSALVHRGPDDEGLYAEPGLALGHRRLSIIDLSAAGHQPMSFADGRYQIIYNGELFNFRELKEELKEFSFQTATDTEVLLAAYVKWGKNCLYKLNGMFGFAIWDAQKKELFIARDRLGIKPLYWTFLDETLLFASEIRSLLEGGLVPRELNHAVLGDYLRYQTVHAPQTIIKNVNMLLPGHYLVASAEGISIAEWWKPEISEQPQKPYREVCRDVRNLLRASVKRRLIADVPFGAFLSGGIDSSAIVGLMSEVAEKKVQTFSVIFDDSEFSEAAHARRIAGKFGTDHHEIFLKADDFLKQLPDALNAMDHPSGDGPNTYVVSRATKNAGITMALSGLGGDELFAGYDIFKRAAVLEKKEWMNALPLRFRQAGGNLMRLMRPGMRGEKIAAVLELERISFASFYPLSRQVLLEKQVRQLTNVLAEPEIIVRSIAAQINKDFPGDDNLLSRVSIAEITTYMQNVLLRDTDQMSMAHALEVRVPFLDYTLVEYVLNLPDQYKYPSTPKKLLTDALEGLLPDEIINRPKMGFTLPWKHWMRNELRGFCEERLTKLGAYDSLNDAGIQALWQSFLANDPGVTWSRIWPLVVLSHWLEKNKVHA
ncbi:MAG TPA: asparagine synthase (glutamine-hydrolyzing) [Bacteroidia bacterium]|nr:asparagine synthase (glutamine-hydrolyzing) [Bacteroidia bacterium]